MTRPQAQLRPRTKLLTAPFSWLFAVTLLLLLAACGGDETSMDENVATPTRPAAATVQPTTAPQPTPTPAPTATPRTGYRYYQ